MLIPMPIQPLSLPSDLSTKAIALAANFHPDPKNPDSVTTIGSEARQRSAVISNKLLQRVKVKDAGEAGELLLKLSIACKNVDVDRLKPGWKSKLAKLPYFGKVFSSGQVMLEGNTNQLDEIDNTASKLTTCKEVLVRDIQDLDVLFQENLSTYQDLQVALAAGSIKLKEIDSEWIPAAKQKADASKDIVDSQALSDLQTMRDRLDKHLYDLRITAEIRSQFMPKIRFAQTGNIILADKLQSSVLNTVPLWKDNMALAITQQRQKQAADIQDKVDYTTNALLRSSADMLHTNSVQIAKQAQRGVVDIETLKYTQAQLVASIDEVRKIAEEGVKSRESARVEMDGLHGVLQKRLSA